MRALPLQKPAKREPKPRKPLKRTGFKRSADRQARIKKKRIKAELDELWVQVRTAWFILNPSEDDYYQCALCPYAVHISVVTLDHIIPRSRKPYLKYNFQNLQPTHWLCNVRKGSLSMERYLARYCPDGRWTSEVLDYGALQASPPPYSVSALRG